MLACQLQGAEILGKLLFYVLRSEVSFYSIESYLRPYFTENLLLSVFRPCSSECLLCRSSIILNYLTHHAQVFGEY